MSMRFDPHVRLAIGLGCRKAVTASAVTALVRRVLAHIGASDSQGATLFTITDRQDTRALYEAAGELALPLVFLPHERLVAASAQARTRSSRVIALFGLPSVAETAALAGAGTGATLLVPRMSADGAACALACVMNEGLDP